MCTHTAKKIEKKEKDGKRKEGDKEKQVELRKGQGDKACYCTAH